MAWGAGTGFVRYAAQQPGIVFCARIADHPKPWFRYVPLSPELGPQVDESGEPIVIDDTLTCLAQADPGSSDVTSIFEAALAAQVCYDAAFDAWKVAKDHIHQAWMYNADPANISRPVPKVMRDAAESSVATAPTWVKARITLSHAWRHPIHCGSSALSGTRLTTRCSLTARRLTGYLPSRITLGWCSSQLPGRSRRSSRTTST